MFKRVILLPCVWRKEHICMRWVVLGVADECPSSHRRFEEAAAMAQPLSTDRGYALSLHPVRNSWNCVGRWILFDFDQCNAA